MKNHIYLIVTLLIIIVITLTACGRQPTSAPSTATVPNSLQTIEAAAEDIIDYAPGGNWDKINKDVTDTENAWKSYELQAGRDGASKEIQEAMNSALMNLKSAATAKNAAATMQGSNDVSAAVVELFALYATKVPVDIGRLDVLERQVILDVSAQDYAAATKSLDRTKSVWEAVKPSVLEHKGKNVAAQFEASLAAQAGALDAKDDATLTKEARDGLEIVDALEQLY